MCLKLEDRFSNPAEPKIKILKRFLNSDLLCLTAARSHLLLLPRPFTHLLLIFILPRPLLLSPAFSFFRFPFISNSARIPLFPAISFFLSAAFRLSCLCARSRGHLCSRCSPACHCFSGSQRDLAGNRGTGENGSSVRRDCRNAKSILLLIHC